MLMRTEPLRDFMFSNLFEDTRSLTAAMDAYRVGDVITLQLDLPGVDPSSIDVQIERGELRVSARRAVTAPDDAQFLVRERADAAVSRRIMLGDVLDVEHVDAEYVDGILTLRIPLHETAKSRRIDVRHSASDDEQQRSIPVEAS